MRFQALTILIFSVLSFYLPASSFAASNCDDLLVSTNYVGLVPKKVKSFVGRFPIQPGTLISKREFWYHFVHQLSKIDFSKAPYEISLDYSHFYLEGIGLALGAVKTQSFYISPAIVEGWKKIGLVKDDRFNLELIPSDIAKIFAQKTDFKVREVKFVIPIFGNLASTDKFALDLYSKRLQFADIHDYLLHTGLLASSVKTEKMIRLLGITEWIVRRRSSGGLNSFLEEGAASNEPIIIGPLGPAIVRLYSSNLVHREPLHPTLTSYLITLYEALVSQSKVSHVSTEVTRVGSIFPKLEDNRAAFLLQSYVDLAIWAEDSHLFLYTDDWAPRRATVAKIQAETLEELKDLEGLIEQDQELIQKVLQLIHERRR